MAKSTRNTSPHICKILTFDNDVDKNDKHCKLSIINEKGDSQYYSSNKSYKDNEQKYPDKKTTMVKRTDNKNNNLSKRDQYLSCDDSSSYSYFPRNYWKKGCIESHNNKHQKYYSSDSSKTENTVTNRDSCLSCISTVSSESSNNRKLNQSNKKISENGKQIDFASQAHRRYQTNFKAAYEDSEISSIYSSSSKYTTENEIVKSHHHPNRKSTICHRPPPKISRMTDPHTHEKPRTFVAPKSISLQTQTAEPKQKKHNSRSERKKTAEKESSICAVSMRTWGNDQQNNLKPYIDRLDKETTNRNLPYSNSHKPINVVGTDPLLDYTNNGLNDRNAMEKGQTKRSTGVTGPDGVARTQKRVENNVGINAFPRKNNQRPWLLKIFNRKRRKRRRRNIHISFKRRKRRRRLRKRSRNHMTAKPKPVPDKDRNHKLKVNTSKNSNESNRLVDFKDSKTDHSNDSNSLIEGLKSVLTKVCKYQSRDTNRNLEQDREEKSSDKDRNNNRNNHDTVRNKKPFNRNENNYFGGEIGMNEKRSPEMRCHSPMPKVIVNTVDQVIPTHKIPYAQSDDSCNSQIKDRDEIKKINRRQTPNAFEKEVSSKDIVRVESGKVNIDLGDIYTLPDQMKPDINKVAKSPRNLLRSLCKHSLACIIAVIWSPCLLVVGLCWLLTYPVRPTKPAGQSRNNIFCRAFNHWLRRNINPCCLLTNKLRRRKLTSRQKLYVNDNNHVRRISTAKQRIPYKIKKDYLIYPCSVHNTRNSKPNEINRHGLKLVTFPSDPEYSKCKMRPLIEREVATKLNMEQSRKQNYSEGIRRNKSEIKKTIHKEIGASHISKIEQISEVETKKGPKVAVGCMCSSSPKADNFTSNTVHTNPNDKEKKVTFTWQKAENKISSSNEVQKDLRIRDKVPIDRISRDVVPKQQELTCSSGKVRGDLGLSHMEKKFTCACGKEPKNHCDCNKEPKDSGLREKVPKDRASRDMTQNITCSGDKVHAGNPGSSRDKVRIDVKFRDKVPYDPCFWDKSKIDEHRRGSLHKDRGLCDMVPKRICSYEKAPKDPNPREKLQEDGLGDKAAKNSSPRNRIPRDRYSRDIVQETNNSWYDKVPKYPGPYHKPPENTDLHDNLQKNTGSHDKVPKDPGIHYKVPKDRSSRDKAKIVIYLHDRVPKAKGHKDRGKGINLNESIPIDPGSHYKISRDRNPRNEVSDKLNSPDITKDLNYWYDNSSKAFGPRDKGIEEPASHNRAPKDRGSFNKEIKHPRRNNEKKVINPHEEVLKDPGLHYKIPRGRDFCDIKQRVSFSRDEVPEHRSSRNNVHEDKKLTWSCGKKPRDHCSCDKDIVLKIIRSSREMVSKDQKLSCSCGKASKDHCECDNLPQEPISTDRVPKDRITPDKVLKDHKFGSCGKVPQDYECNKLSQDPVLRDRVPKNHFSRNKVQKDLKFTCTCGKVPQDLCECSKVPKIPDFRDEIPKEHTSRDGRSKFISSEDKVPKDPDSSNDKLTKYCYYSSNKKVEDPSSRDMEQKFICACDKVPKDHCECNKLPKDLISHHMVPNDRLSRDLEQKLDCACDKIPKPHCECVKESKDLVSQDKVPKDRFSREMARKVTFSGVKASEASCPRHKVPKDPDSRDMKQKFSCSKSKVRKHYCSHDKHKLDESNEQEKKPIRNFNTRKTCNKSNKRNEVKRTKSKPDLRKRKTKSITNFVACRFRKWKEEFNPLIECNLASYQNCQKYLGKPPSRPFVRSSPNLRETLGHFLNIMTCCVAGLFCLPWIFFCQICCKLFCCCE